MDEATKQAYERAAVALERHDVIRDFVSVDDSIAGKAWCKAFRAAPQMTTYSAIDLAAARLLRECIAKGEPLP